MELYWDKNSGELLKNRYIAVVDRQFVAINKEIDSWIGSEYIYHTGWRKRPDTLWAMSPLDNLVGLLYRIDHFGKPQGLTYLICLLTQLLFRKEMLP